MKQTLNANKPKTADEYILAAPLEKQTLLKQLRQTIKKAAPKAEEVISYNVVCYKYYGMLVGFGTHKIGYSLYTMSTTLPKEFSKEYKNLMYSHSTIHFDKELHLPVAMVKKIVEQRVKMNEVKQMMRASKKSHNKKK